MPIRVLPYTEKTILQLVDGIFAAAADPGQWTAFGKQLSEVVHGTSTVVHHQHAYSQDGSISENWNMDPSFTGAYLQYYSRCNPWFLTHPEKIQEGRVYLGAMLCPEEEMARSEFCDGWLLPQKLFHLLGATPLKNGSVSSNISIMRPKSMGAFHETDYALLTALMPYLQRAFQLNNRIQKLESRGNSAADALDSLPSGVILLDAQGKVVLVNRTAAAIVQQEKALRLTADGVQAATPQENARLKALLHGALATGNGRIAEPGGVMQVTRQDTHRPLYLLITPLRLKTVHLGRAVPVVAIFITDPEMELPLNPRHFQELYGLTHAESKLAKALAAGKSLKEAAAELRVGESTLRSHLKSVFLKTHTRRQSDLVRLLISAPTRFATDKLING